MFIQFIDDDENFEITCDVTSENGVCVPDMDTVTLKAYVCFLGIMVPVRYTDLPFPQIARIARIIENQFQKEMGARNANRNFDDAEARRGS